MTGVDRRVPTSRPELRVRAAVTARRAACTSARCRCCGGCSPTSARMLADGPDVDAVTQRLFPRAYLDPTEEEAESQWQSARARRSRRDAPRRDDARSPTASTRAPPVPGRDGHARGRARRRAGREQWIGVLNDARLALGTALGRHRRDGPRARSTRRPQLRRPARLRLADPAPRRAARRVGGRSAGTTRGATTPSRRGPEGGADLEPRSGAFGGPLPWRRMQLPNAASPARPRDPRAVAADLFDAVASAVRGAPDTVRLALVALLSGGHLLVEGMPGTGKTLLAKSLAAAIGGRFGRVQCTPDLLPADVTGTSVYGPATGEWDFRPGPIFANVVLVDEVNRASPRTQAALLEPMEERQVTVDGVDAPAARSVLRRRDAEPVRQRGHVPAAREPARPLRARVHARPARPAPPNARSSTVRAASTRSTCCAPVTDPGRARRHRSRRCAACTARTPCATTCSTSPTRRATIPAIVLGASPRASLGLLRAAQAHATVMGRDFVSPDDVKSVAPVGARAPDRAGARRRRTRRLAGGRRDRRRGRVASSVIP